MNYASCTTLLSLLPCISHSPSSRLARAIFYVLIALLDVILPCWRTALCLAASFFWSIHNRFLIYYYWMGTNTMVVDITDFYWGLAFIRFEENAQPQVSWMGWAYYTKQISFSYNMHSSTRFWFDGNAVSQVETILKNAGCTARDEIR